jgi:hypothetical protein
LFIFAFFTQAITPPFAARLSDTEPGLGARSKTAPASPFCPFATVTVLAFAGFSRHFAYGLAVSQTGEASSKRQGDGQRFQKKAMKTKYKRVEASAPANVRPSSVSKSGNQDKLPRLDLAKRNPNRQLPTDEVLRKLENEAPLLLRMAQIVGKWVWIQFPERQPREVTSILAQVGFHWNKRRQLWQHPCGIESEAATGNYDPRKRYGCHAAIA